MEMAEIIKVWLCLVDFPFHLAVLYEKDVGRDHYALPCGKVMTSVV